MPNKEQEFELWKQYKAGDKDAGFELMDSMTPLWMGQVNKFRASGLPRTALETKARLLTMQAFDTYNPEKSQLNTHTTNYLKHLQRYVLNYQNIGKIPEHRALAITRFKNVRSNLEEQLGREPTTVELADALQWSGAEVERMQTELRQDLVITQGKEESFFDYTRPEDDGGLKDAVQFVYYSVDPEKQKVLEYTFGLGGNPKLNVKDMAGRMGKSENYIRRLRKELALKINDITEMRY